MAKDFVKKCLSSNLTDKNAIYYSKEIKQTFTKIEIFNIFKNNKKILLYLIKKEMTIIDNNIEKEIILKGKRYCHFFYPELKENEEFKNELLKRDSKIFDNFEDKRREGENDSYIFFFNS